MPDWMSPSILALAAVEMTGPMSAPGSHPAFTFIALAQREVSFPTKTATDIAMQRCPAAPNAAPASAFTVASKGASSVMITA